MTPNDACTLLDADHIAVKHLFVDYARLAMAAPDDSRDERHAIARKICDELSVHAQLEEEIFYPALRKALAGATDLLAEAKGEHDEIRRQVAAIRDLPGAGPEMDASVAELAGCVEHHVKEERDQLFPKARASQLDLQELGGRLQARRQELG